MKVLLGCLMCRVLTLAQTFAISGGPWSGPGHVTVSGIYAGVLVPIPPVNPAPPPPTLPADNSLALFTLTVPQKGLATGVSAVFRNGIFYSGTIKGSADPDSGKLSAIVNATFLQESTVSSTTTNIKSEYDANGQFTTAKIVANTNTGSPATARIRGKASLTYKNIRNDSNPPDPDGQGGPIEYKVKGFKQSEATS